MASAKGGASPTSELLDAGAGGLLVAMAEACGAVALTEIDEGAWEQVAAAYGYDPTTASQHSRVVGLVRRHDRPVLRLRPHRPTR